MCLGLGSWTDERDDDAWNVSVTHRDLGWFLPWWQLCSAAPPATPPGPSAARGRPGRRRRTGSSEPGRRLRPPEGAGQTFSSSLCFFSYSFAGGTRLLKILPVQLVHTCATGKVSRAVVLGRVRCIIRPGTCSRGLEMIESRQNSSVETLKMEVRGMKSASFLLGKRKILLKPFRPKIYT